MPKVSWRLALGSNPNASTTVVLFDSFADLDTFGPAFMKAIAEAKLFPASGIVVQRGYQVISKIPELALQASAPAKR
jgi:hypothetical protein